LTDGEEAESKDFASHWILSTLLDGLGVPLAPGLVLIRAADHDDERELLVIVIGGLVGLVDQGSQCPRYHP
jgi:hypothetical protein